MGDDSSKRVVIKNLRDIESVRDTPRFKSRTSKNVIKTLNINKLHKQRVKLTLHK